MVLKTRVSSERLLFIPQILPYPMHSDTATPPILNYLSEVLNSNNYLKIKYTCRNPNVRRVLRIPSYALLHFCVIRYCSRVSHLTAFPSATLQTERTRKSVPAVATFRLFSCKQTRKFCRPFVTVTSC